MNENGELLPGLRQELVAAAERRQKWQRRRPKIFAAVAIASSTLLAGVLLIDRDGTEEGNIGCKNLDIEIIDQQERIIEARTELESEGDAEFEHMSYIFEEGEIAEEFSHPFPVRHDYPNTQELEHVITAFPVYELNGTLFGGLPVCDETVVFSR